MMLALRSLAFNVLFFVSQVLLLVICLPALVLPDPAMVWAQRLWARTILVLLAVVCGLRHEIRGRERLLATPCIIASKHESAWDTVIFLLLLRRPGYVVKRELLRVPLFGWYLQRGGSIAIDRKGGASALRRMIASARRTIAEGRHIVIFPEGTRVAPGQRLPYHPGVAALYTKLEVPVVPVALNSGLFWARRSILKKPGRIVLEFLEPIAPGLPRKDFLATLERRIEDASARLAEEARAGPSGGGA